MKSCQNLTELFPFSYLGILPIKDLVNKISREPFELGSWYLATDCVQGVDDLINIWQKSVNTWLNYLSFPTLSFCVEN